MSNPCVNTVEGLFFRGIVPHVNKLSAIELTSFNTSSALSKLNSYFRFASQVRSFDALHVACAIIANADLFITTDDTLLRKLRSHPDLTALPPGDALAYVEHWYED